jgi:O-antigen ligase
MQRRPSDFSFLERACLVQTGLLFIGTSWAFGGNADWVRPEVTWGALAGAALTVAAALAPARHRVAAGRWWLLAPLLAFNALTLIATATPAFRPIHFGGELLYLPRYVPAWRPSAAWPALVGPTLLLFDGLYLSAFNLFLLVRRRRALRALLLVLVGNGLVLAAFGTVQKLVHAPGIYFGRVRSPQDYFFASFVYDNHWGAFIVLMTGAALALAWHHAGRSAGRNFYHTPGFGALVAVAVLAATVPLSGARVCTLLILVLLLEAGVRWLARLRRGGEEGPAVRRKLIGGALAALCAAGAAWYFAQDVIAARLAKTRDQVAVMRTAHSIGNRALLYDDTWRMAADRPWFGWGMASYPLVFPIYNRQEPDPVDRLPKVYHDAHSDWLQALAEHGFVGTVLLALCAVVPWCGATGSPARGSVSRQLLVGCALVLLYAGVEFPFGNTAVVLAWWVFFFTALRYAELSRRPATPAAAP